LISSIISKYHIYKRYIMAFTYYNTTADSRSKGTSYEDEMLSWANMSGNYTGIPSRVTRSSTITRSSTGATSKSSGYAPTPQLPGANTKGFAGRKIDTYDRSFDGSGHDTMCPHDEGSADLSGYHDDGFVVSDDEPADDEPFDHGGGAGAADEDDDSAWDPDETSMTTPIRYRADSYVSPPSRPQKNQPRWTKKTHVPESDSDADLPTPELSSKSSLNDFLAAVGLDDGRIDITQFPPIPDLMDQLLVHFSRVATQFEDAGLTGLEAGSLLVEIVDAIDYNPSGSDDSDSDYTPYVHHSEITNGSSSAQSSAQSTESDGPPPLESGSDSDSDYSPSDSDDYDSDYDYDQVRTVRQLHHHQRRSRRLRVGGQARPDSQS
jgi:hypothetical protein